MEIETNTNREIDRKTDWQKYNKWDGQKNGVKLKGKTRERKTHT